MSRVDELVSTERSAAESTTRTRSSSAGDGFFLAEDAIAIRQFGFAPRNAVLELEPRSCHHYDFLIASTSTTK